MVTTCKSQPNFQPIPPPYEMKHHKLYTKNKCIKRDKPSTGVIMVIILYLLEK